jgi:hypothetical protein
MRNSTLWALNSDNSSLKSDIIGAVVPPAHARACELAHKADAFRGGFGVRDEVGQDRVAGADHPGCDLALSIAGHVLMISLEHELAHGTACRLGAI